MNGDHVSAADQERAGERDLIGCLRSDFEVREQRAEGVDLLSGNVATWVIDHGECR